MDPNDTLESLIKGDIQPIDTMASVTRVVVEADERIK